MLNYIISVSGKNISPELMDELGNKFSDIEQLPGEWHLSGKENEIIYAGRRSDESPLTSKDIGILEEMFKIKGEKIKFHKLQEMQ